jgi:hypothetical protein
MQYYGAWNMLASRLQKWVLGGNNWTKMLQVDAMVPCTEVQLVFQSASNGLCTRGHGRRGGHTEKGYYFVPLMMVGFEKAYDTVLERSECV